MAADYKRIHRLLKIYTLIQGDQGWTCERLADEFKTSQRTIFRDIDVLRSIGMPVFHDPERKCYQIRRDFYMPPLELTFEESLALISLGRYIHDEEQIPFTGPALKAMAKIRSQLPPAVRRELDLIEDHLAIKLSASAPQDGFRDFYALIQKAIATRTRLRCRYESSSAGDATASKPTGWFQLSPYCLFFSQRAWYVVGFHSLRDEVRTLKLNRFADMQPTDIAYELPKTFTLEKHLGNAWRMMRGNRRHDVEIIFDASFAETISDTSWHKTQSFELLPDGSLRFACTVDGLDEIVWWVLSMGAHCRVVRPQELIQRVRDESQRMLALYASPPAPAASTPRLAIAGGR
jgi:predicted DNA-binding transcriptional regulator YafY